MRIEKARPDYSSIYHSGSNKSVSSTDYRLTGDIQLVSCKPKNILADLRNMLSFPQWNLSSCWIERVCMTGHHQISQWRHGIEMLSALLALCEGNPSVTAGFPSHKLNIILLTQKASNAELCYFDGRLNKVCEQTDESPVTWDVMTLMWRHCKYINSRAQEDVFSFLMANTFVSVIIRPDITRYPILQGTTSAAITMTEHTMVTSSNGNIFRVTGPLWGESAGDRWIPLTEASEAELWCFLCDWPHGWAYNRNDGDLRRHRANYDVTVMITPTKHSSHVSCVVSLSSTWMKS